MDGRWYDEDEFDDDYFGCDQIGPPCPRCGKATEENAHWHEWGPLRVFDHPLLAESGYREVTLKDIFPKDIAEREFGNNAPCLIGFQFVCRSCQKAIDIDWDADPYWRGGDHLREQIRDIFDREKRVMELRKVKCSTCGKALTDENRRWFGDCDMLTYLCEQCMAERSSCHNEYGGRRHG